MSKLQFEEEAVMTSEYSYIILGLLRSHPNLSLVKTIIFTYIIKKQRFYWTSLYSGKNINNTVLKCISQLSGLFDDYCLNQKYIIQAIHLLISNKDIEISNFFLKANNMTLNIESITDKFLDLAIEESRRFSDRQMIKEIVGNV